MTTTTDTEKGAEGDTQQHGLEHGEASKGIPPSKNRYLLYSCGGDGNILEFDPAKPNKSPKNINLHIGSANAPSADVKVPCPARSRRSVCACALPR
jgi:hypothetical protein